MDLKFRAFSLSVFLVFLLSVPNWGHAQSGSDEQRRQRDFDVPQLPLTPALQTLFGQAGVHYGYIPNSPEEEQILVGPLNGHYTLEDAFTMLLPDGFVLSWVNERTVSVVPPPLTTAPSMPSGTANGFVTHDQRPIEAMLVRDSRLWSLESELPSLIVLDEQDIRSLGASTAAEVLEYLPQQPFMRTAGFRVSGEQYADLRGLGPDSTLILINGRRVNASATSFDSNAFDLNTIPLAAVQRVEVLLDSMAVAAGADSIGGVINFILRERYDAPTLEARYGTAAGGADEMRFSAGADRTITALHLSGLVDYFSRRGLLGSQRDRWRDQDYRRFGSADLRSPDTNPGNVTSATLADLPGLGSRVAAVPHHDPGSPLTIEDFRATDGIRNLESAYVYRSILPQTDRLSFVGSATLALPQRTSAFGELLITDRSATLRDIPVALSNIVVPVSNPYNPFGVPVIGHFLLSDVEPHTHVTQSQFTRALLGLRHQTTRWSSELTVVRIEDSARLTSHNEVDFANVAAALAQTDPALALNVFDDGPGASPEVLRTLIRPPVKRAFASHETQMSALLHGLPLALRAGQVSTLLGVEYRQSDISVTGLSEGHAARSVRAAFAEVRLPLLADTGSRGQAQDTVTLSLSSRWDDFSDLGSTSHSNAALVWRHTRDWQFRASYGSSFRAPSLWELYQPKVSFPFALPDPKRHNEIAAVTATVGGNPELDAATSRSWSLGFRWQQPALGDIQLSGSSWHVVIDRRLTPVSVPALFAREDLFPDRIERAAPSESDVVLGLPGQLLKLDFTAANVGRLNANGLDLTLSGAIDSAFGRLAASLSATWMNKFTTVDVPGMDVTDRVAFASVFGTIPKWRAVGRIDWTRGAASVTAAVRFVSRYDDFDVLQNQPSARVIRSHATLDLQGSMDIPETAASEAFWRDMRLTIGVENVLDSSPQFAEVGGYFGFDPTQGDLRKRFGYVRLTKRF